MPLYLLIPLLAAILFALSNMLVKRAYDTGATLTQPFHLANFLGLLLFLPLLLFETQDIDRALLWQPMVVGALVYVGALASFLAVQSADVSLVTPLMGTKVVFVAIATVILTDIALSPLLWTAAFLTTAGILAMGIKDVSKNRKMLAGIGYALFCSLAFAVSDVLLQQWASGLGSFAFITMIAVTMAGLSLVQIAVQRVPVFKAPAPSRKWIWSSAAIITFQGLMLALALAFFNDATGINVVYGSRGVWSLILLGLFGTHLGMQERKTPKDVMLWRIIGTALLTIGIIVAVIART